MSDDRWEVGTWEGSRRAQLRRALRLTVRQRLQLMEELTASANRLAAVGRKAWAEGKRPEQQIRSTSER